MGRETPPQAMAEITRTHVGHESSDVLPNPAAEPSTWIGTGSSVGTYRLLRLLGRGGMGEVYEAEDVSSGRRFAVKLLSPRLPRTAETVERFLNEASLAASISHPQTTFVYGAGQDGGHFYIAMELMPGRTLKDRVEADGPLAVGEAVDRVLDILDGLEATHAKGMIHRDVKPSNCFLDGAGRVKVGDFGLAKSLIAGADITQTGAFLGTPQFAAPEQIRRGTVDARTDLFSVGATLFYLLAGRAPYEGDPASVIAQIVADPPPRVRQFRPEVPPALERIIVRSLSKNPKRRYRSAWHLRGALEPYSGRGVSMADIGRRMAAFFLDLILVLLITFAGRAAGIALMVAMMLLDSPVLIEPAFPFVAEVSLWFVVYFALTEGLWGRSPAKHWLGMRVVSTLGDPPGLWRSALRAAVFPGVFLTTVDVGHALLANSAAYMQWIETLAPNEILRRIVVPDILLLIKVSLCLVCFSSMRRANGYRGWHEWLSGTRVVRTSTAASPSTLLPPAIDRLEPPPPDAPSQLGAFHVVGALGGDDHVTVLQGRDDSLTRPVWLLWSPSARPVPEQRLAVDRRTRQRVLQSGCFQDRHWTALESVDGTPLRRALDEQGQLPWELARRLLPALADELAAAVADDTLPNPVSLDHLWLDQHGQLRLLDVPLKPPVHSLPAAEGGRPADDLPAGLRAAQLLSEVAAYARPDAAVPGEAVDFLHSLPRANLAPHALTSLSKRLRDLGDIPYQLAWDTRLGMLAVSAGVEMVLVSTWCFLVAWMASRLAPNDLYAAVALALPAALALPVTLGGVLQGGLAFRLCGFETRTAHTQQRSARRAAIRSFWAWLPIIVPETIQKVAAVVVSGLRSAEQLPLEAALARHFPEIVLLAVPALIFTLVAAIGICGSLVSPRRGIQDRLAGTYLVHR